MANVFLTPKQVAQEFLDAGARAVEEMSLEACHRLAAIESVHPGINGAIIASMASAARKRLVAFALAWPKVEH